MSCEYKWREDVELLSAATQLDPGTADAAPRCSKPECNRPLRKDGTCVMGHPQSAAEQAPAYPPQVDAVQCAIEHLATLRQWPVGTWAQIAVQSTTTAMQQLLGQKDTWSTTPRAGEDALLTMLQLFDGLRNRVYEPGERALVLRWDEDARIRVARAAAIDLLLRRAETALAATPPDWGTAWENLEAATDHSQRTSGHYRTSQSDRIKALHSRIFPVSANRAGYILANAVSLQTGLPFGCAVTLPSGFRLLPKGDSQRRTDVSGYGFSPAARQTLESIGLTPEQTECAVSLDQAHDVIMGQAQAARTAWQDFITAAQAYKQQVAAHPAAARGDNAAEAAQLARDYALPLWQAAGRVRQHLPALHALAEEDPDLERGLSQVSTTEAEAMGTLGRAPVGMLPRILAALHYAPRVMDLLKFKAVREAVFRVGAVDMLAELPHLAPHAVAGLRLCEQVEALAAQADTNSPPLHAADLGTLIQASADLAQVLSPPRGLSRSDTQTMLNRLVDALSEHVPPERAPARRDKHPGLGDSFFGGARLRQSQLALQGLWTCVAMDTTAFPLDVLRTRGAAAGMPYADYAARTDITLWFSQSGEPASQAMFTDNRVWSLLRAQQRNSLLAVDRSGLKRTYKKGERVRSEVAGVIHEGVVTACRFTRSPDEDSDRPTVAIPAVTFAQADGRLLTVPIAQVEFVPKSRKKP